MLFLALKDRSGELLEVLVTLLVATCSILTALGTAIIPGSVLENGPVIALLCAACLATGTCVLGKFEKELQKILDVGMPADLTDREKAERKATYRATCRRTASLGRLTFVVTCALHVGACLHVFIAAAYLSEQLFLPVEHPAFSDSVVPVFMFVSGIVGFCVALAAPWNILNARRARDLLLSELEGRKA
ncbi:hypothetical protein [Paracoccus sp. ME4]|uniref:hypothetical protein n=1 Tax=Paracoccus sp. ME4 TaxID=3138066 RepID=UPI00398BA60F